MKKIIFYTDTPLFGGAEKHMLLLAKKINPEMFDIQLACSDYKSLNEWCLAWKKSGFKVHRFKVSHKHDPRHLLCLRRLLKTEKPDILHIHLWNPGAARYAFSAVDKKITKIVTTEHDPFLLKGLKNSIRKSCIKKTDFTITVSEKNKTLLLKGYPLMKNKIATVHNGIDIQDFENKLIHFSAQEKHKIKQNKFKAENNEFIIISVATLHPRKGIDFLIKAFKKINENYPDTKLVIVGEGPEKKKYEKLITNLELDNKVVLTGFADNIPQILKSADLFVLASIKEAFGLVLLEAMAAQLPIIATKVGGIPEIITSNKNGILVEEKNTEELVNAISQLLQNVPLRQKLAYVGNHDVKKFTAEEMAKETQKIYNYVLTK
jgi:glycosyltransferase involved in cell wall biosynthesis